MDIIHRGLERDKTISGVMKRGYGYYT